MENITIEANKLNGELFYSTVTSRKIDYMHAAEFKNIKYQINMIVKKRRIFEKNDLFLALIPFEEQELTERRKEAQKVLSYFLSFLRNKGFDTLRTKFRKNPVVTIAGRKYAVRWLVG